MKKNYIFSIQLDILPDIRYPANELAGYPAKLLSASNIIWEKMLNFEGGLHFSRVELNGISFKRFFFN